jgi:hypothetical protein
MKARIELMLQRLKGIKEHYGTLIDVSELHRLEAVGYDWVLTPPVSTYQGFSSFFASCVEADVFDHIYNEKQQRYSSFPAFNRLGYRAVEAFLKTLEIYTSNALQEVIVEGIIDTAAMQAYMVLVGHKTLRDYESTLLGRDIDFFPKTAKRRASLSSYNDQKKCIEFAGLAVDAMPDFQRGEYFDDMQAIRAVVCAVSGLSMPTVRG